MKCKDCELKSFSRGYPEHVKSSGISRYYCEHPIAYKRAESVGSHAREICRTKRGCKELTIKTSPKWCPLRGESQYD